MRRFVLALLLALAALPSASAPAQGVTLYRDRRMRGPSMMFRSDVPDLSRTPFGKNRASSVAVPLGCEAILYDRTEYRGRRSVLRADEPNLADTEVGEDSVSSLRVRCRSGWDGQDEEDGEGEPQEEERGVRLFRDRRLQGPSQLFTEDEPDLSRTRFGSNRASSLALSPGCVAVLYERRSYRGRQTTFRESDNDLANTQVGEDRASSLKVRCRDGRWEPGDELAEEEDGQQPQEPEGRGVRLFRDRDLEGPSQLFANDEPDLARTPFGARRASSLDVAPGCVAILFELPGYQGRRTEFKERDNNLANTPLGEDTASSVQVRCGR